jgi:toxin YoeB
VSIRFSARAWADYLHWQQTDKKMVRRINALIESASRTPFEGIGKPEPLRGGLSGFWSRRVDQEHRLVYRPSGDVLEVASCRFHYA